MNCPFKAPAQGGQMRVIKVFQVAWSICNQKFPRIASASNETTVGASEEKKMIGKISWKILDNRLHLHKIIDHAPEMQNQTKCGACRRFLFFHPTRVERWLWEFYKRSLQRVVLVWGRMNDCRSARYTVAVGHQCRTSRVVIIIIESVNDAATHAILR